MCGADPPGTHFCFPRFRPGPKVAAVAKKLAAKKKSAAKKAANIFAFVGSDEARVKEEALKRFRELVPPEEADFGAEVIDGGADNAESAVRAVNDTMAALQTLPFFGGNKVVWLKGATFFADNQTGKAQSVLDAAEALADALAAGLPESVTFLLSAPAIDKRRAFYKTLNKVAPVEVFDRLDLGRDGWQENVARHVRKLARERRLDFDDEALELFVMLAGDESGQIGAELEKIDLFLGPDERRVTAEIVRQQVSLSRAGVVFELGDRIAKRDLAGALAVVDHLLFQGENPIGVLLAAVAPTLRRMLVAKDLIANHGLRPGRNFRAFEAEVARLPAAATAHLPRKKDGSLSVYPVFLAAGEVRAFSEAELRTGLRACLDANRALVTSNLEPRLVLERLIVRLLTRERAA